MNDNHWNDRELAALKRALQQQHGTGCACTKCAEELRKKLEEDAKKKAKA